MADRLGNDVRTETVSRSGGVVAGSGAGLEGREGAGLSADVDGVRTTLEDFCIGVVQPARGIRITTAIFTRHRIWVTARLRIDLRPFGEEHRCLPVW